MKLSNGAAWVALILAAGPSPAFADTFPRFSTVDAFLVAYGDHAVEVAPNVYRIDRGAGRFTEVGFGQAALRRDLDRLRQMRLAAGTQKLASSADLTREQIGRLDTGIAVLEKALNPRLPAGSKVSDANGEYLCNEGGAYVSADAVAGLAYGDASASAQISVFGPPNPQPPSFTGCAYSAVLLGSSGLVAYGNNNGCDAPINTLGSPRQTQTGSFGPDFCPKSAATSWVVGSGASCDGYPSYVSVYAEDNPCNLP